MELTLSGNFLTVMENSIVGSSSRRSTFKWIQLTHVLPREWKEAISTHNGSLEDLLIQDHHLIKKNQILRLTQLTVIDCARYKL